LISPIVITAAKKKLGKTRGLLLSRPEVTT
jgi:hypothetical protein